MNWIQIELIQVNCIVLIDLQIMLASQTQENPLLLTRLLETEKENSFLICGQH